jgi:antirestriction protein ArdC
MPAASRPSLEERRADAEQMLNRELRRIVDSGEYGDWFRRMSLFHRYAPANSMWIMAQLAERVPDATGTVASFRTWAQLGRHVRKGEPGIMVWYPKPYWVDKATGERTRPPAGKAERARLKRRVSFGIGYVWDACQTDGEPLPQLGRPAPEQAPYGLFDHLDGYCRANRIIVEVRRLSGGVAGYYQRETDRIVLDAGASLGERVATLAHELAHREDPELIAAHKAGDRSYYAHNRPDCEAVAEAAAHTISARFGFDLTAHSAGYIAGWIRGDVDRFKQLHERVGQVARPLVPPDNLDRLIDAARAQAVLEQPRRPRPAGRAR